MFKSLWHAYKLRRIAANRRRETELLQSMCVHKYAFGGKDNDSLYEAQYVNICHVCGHIAYHPNEATARLAVVASAIKRERYEEQAKYDVDK